MKVRMLQTVTNSLGPTVYHAGRSYELHREVGKAWERAGFCVEEVEPELAPEVKIVASAPENKMEPVPVENKKRGGRKKGA